MNLNQVTIPSLDVSKSMLFYQKLGLELIVHSYDHYARFVCPEGNATFSIHRVDKLPEGQGVWIYFECEDLQNKITELISLGVQFEQLPVDQPWLWTEARLKDPDGNQIILYFAGENRINPPWALKKVKIV